MDSLDDDEKILPEVVSEYYFVDAENAPVSFAELPVQWSNDERSHDNKRVVYLRGNTDNGLQKVHKQVKAWKYEFLKAKPKLSVLSIDNNWIKLQKPRKSFEQIIRTILITVHCLHFFKRKPEASIKDLLSHLYNVFSSYEVRPSENDLIDHLNFIQEAVKRDKTLKTSKFLVSFLKGRSRKKRGFHQNAEVIMKPSFIVNDTIFETKKRAEERESDDVNDNDDIFDTVCAICDNGGDLTCCEGKCLKIISCNCQICKICKVQLHISWSTCRRCEGSSQPFLCLNCSHDQHQCFSCGKLGSSNESVGAEVFCCSDATCGHFYHPHCVANLLEDESDTKARNLEKRIAGGEAFTCPAHKCYECKREENEKVRRLQFAVCRRCPRSYHRKCLPRKIVFYNKDHDDDIVPRAWNNLLPKSRALIYCLNHKLDHDVGTAVRNIKFPKIDHGLKNVAINEDVVRSDHTSIKKGVAKSAPSVRPGDSSRKRAGVSLGLEGAKKQRVSGTYKKGTHIQKNMSTEVEPDSKNDSVRVDEDQQTMIVTENDNFRSVDANSRDRFGKQRVYETYKKGIQKNVSKEVEPDSKKDRVQVDEDKQTPIVTENDNFPSVDANSRDRPGDSSRKRAGTPFELEGAKKQRVSGTYNKKGIQKNLSAQVEPGSKKDRVRVDEDQQTPIVTGNDNIPSVDANSRVRTSTLLKDAAASMKPNMVKRRYGISSSDPSPSVRVANMRLDKKTGKLDTRQQGSNRKAYIEETRKHDTGSLNQRTGYVGDGHDSGGSSRYSLAVADQSSSCNRSSTLAMDRYRPRLDELNPIWRKNRGMKVYNHSIGPVSAPHSTPRIMGRLDDGANVSVKRL